ncbi:MAG: hypothetical protein FD146_297 [Anaerolineaceae bacterium]|nr:MAG: hypothetical protein FD146_297 [Anaerolineaceae bacterium]
MNTLKKTAWLLITAALLALSACGGGAGASPTIDPGAVYTAAVETAYAQLTLTALAVTDTPAEPPTPTATLTPLITNTPLITDTPLITNTPFALTPIGPTQDLCDKFLFISDVTIPDGAIMGPGVTFEKTWRIQNTGPCTWDDGYVIVPGWGDMMSGPYIKKIPHDVKPGEMLDMSITLAAPTTPGEYFGAWRMQNDRGYPFGIALTVLIKVVNP